MREFSCDRENSRQSRQELRDHIFSSWHYRCAYCSVRLTKETASKDHVVSKHKGGKDLLTNLVSCCKSCNQSKGSEHWIGWYRDQDFWDRAREDSIGAWIGGKD